MCGGPAGGEPIRFPLIGTDVGDTLPQRKPATMRDVAARAGVSRSLVSTVFRGVPGASPDTRQRILTAADDLGYRPDDRARRLRSNASSQIGVTLTATQRFHVEVAEALHHSAALRGFDLSIALNTGSRTLAHAVDTLLAQRCAALILIGPAAPEDELARLADLAGDIPVIVVDRYSEVTSVDSLRIDDEAAYRILIGHLVSLGHTDIWHPDGGDYVSAGPRRRSFIAAMASYGLADRARIIPGGGSAMDGAAAALRLSTRDDLPTAIAGYNDRAACGIIDVLWRHGIRVPDDISVTGLDDIPEASMPHMSITTVEQRPESLADAVVTTLMDRLEGAPPRGLQLQAPGRLIVRNSTGPVRLSAVASDDRAG